MLQKLLFLAVMLVCGHAVAGGTVHSTLTVTLTLLPSPCGPDNQDPNCIPVKESRKTTTGTYKVVVPATDRNLPPTMTIVEGTVTTITYEY